MAGPLVVLMTGVCCDPFIGRLYDFIGRLYDAATQRLVP